MVAMVLFGATYNGILVIFPSCGVQYFALINQHVVVVQGFAYGVCRLEASPILVRSCALMREIALWICSDHVRVNLPIV